MTNISYRERESTATPGPSSADDEKLDHLSQMFPEASRSSLVIALSVYGSVESAALSLSSSTSAIDVEDDDGYLEQGVFDQKDSNSLSSLLVKLKKNLSNEKEKLKVDEDDIQNDGMAYYKDPDFDPKKKLRVIYRNQPAADTGGVTR